MYAVKFDQWEKKCPVFSHPLAASLPPSIAAIQSALIAICSSGIESLSLSSASLKVANGNHSRWQWELSAFNATVHSQKIQFSIGSE